MRIGYCCVSGPCDECGAPITWNIYSHTWRHFCGACRQRNAILAEIKRNRASCDEVRDFVMDALKEETSDG